ncbi:MAG: SMC-Scp complex subunit ScpB [Chloroflexi bacterium GWB2_49_20]|nr:MAG: SMC-Scp complex subunit ScpB [Chloroflexi bacterium GWB2_49_20]OGN78147.1 MAG: SMC-Scp complex subunit ScpB [Chloroflexi bacterium GWC2_49_37]OGN85183.1 MAG: SMC-Scp complex subunit ScpB [Chloroflexi bacterium GWD2_49_16]
MSESENLQEIQSELISSIEALLFVAVEPVSPTQLATVLEITTSDVEELLLVLQENYHKRGIRLQWHAGKVLLTSAPEKSEIIEMFLGLEVSSRLSRAALEALAIIAYRQPVTRPSLDAIRGVNSDGVLRSLLSKGLIQEIGRSESPGRPILYGTTPDFLQYFGLSSLGVLPLLKVSDFGTHEVY